MMDLPENVTADASTPSAAESLAHSPFMDAVLTDLLCDASIPLASSSDDENGGSKGERELVEFMWLSVHQIIGASTPKRSAKELVDRATSAAEKSKRKLTHKAENRLIHSAASEYGMDGCLPEDVVGAAQPREVLMDELSESAETGTVEGMQGTLGIFSMVLGRITGVPQSVKNVFAAACSVCRTLPRPVPKKASPEVRRGAYQSVLELVISVTAKVRQLAVGQIVMIPAGFPGRMVLILVRAVSDQKCQVAVACCGGKALRYFPVYHDGLGEQRLNPLIFNDVPRERVEVTTFWIELFKQLLVPEKKSGGAKFVFGTLLPFLNDTPIEGQMNKYPGMVEFASWLHPAIGGDNSCAITCTAALYTILRWLPSPEGFDESTAAWTAFVSTRECVLSLLPGKTLMGMTQRTRRLLCRGLAWYAAEHKKVFPNSRSSPFIAHETSKIEAAIEATLACPDESQQQWRPPSLPDGSIQYSEVNTEFPWFDRLSRIEDEDGLAGPARPPAIVIPVDLCSLQSERIRSVAQLRDFLYNAVTSIALLQNQSEEIPQAQQTSFSLIASAMCRVVPLPTDEEFWRLPELRVEANRSFLLHYTHLLTRHFAAAAFSIDCRSDRASDAVRLVTATMLVVLTDRLCRIVSTDTPSLFAKHYSGKADGPVLPFVLDPGVFGEESSFSLLLWPELCSARAAALEYFQGLQSVVVEGQKERQTLFKFDVSGVKVGPAETQLIEQLGLKLGIGASCREYVPELLTGERSDVLDHCPELAWLRDVVFLSKIVLNSNGEKLPSPSAKGYRSSDARLQWRVDKGKVMVGGFGMKNLEQCAGYNTGVETGKGRMRRMIFQWKRKGKCRSVPSMADPSTLCDDDEEIHSEEDVLYLKHLPDFDGALSPSQVERVLAILTAPYVRIPLLLAFFSDRDRCAALANPRLQMVLDAALYEPGRWTSAPPSSEKFKIPGPVENTYTRDGLLMNELLHCPKQIAVAVGDLVDAAAERDTGRDTAPSQRCILYAARLVSRVCIYVEHAKEWYGEEIDRGEMEECLSILRSKLTGKIWRIVSRWCESSMRKRKYEDANSAHAHLLLLAAARSSCEMDEEEVRVVYGAVLKAQVYLSMHHRWSKPEVPSGVLGGIYNVEVMNTFTLFRRPIYLRLKADGAWAGSLLEDVVKMVSNSDSESPTNRHWTEQGGLPGVFVPQSESSEGDRGEDSGKKEGYAAWLLRVTQPPALTVNVNLGRFTLKQHQPGTLPEWALQFPDFFEVFGEGTTAESVQVAQVETSQFREWYRVVGSRHDLQRWTVDPKWSPGALGGKKLSSQHWARQLLAELPTWTDFIPKNLRLHEEAASGDWCLLSGLCDQGSPRDVVVVSRPSPLVMVFDVVGHGRQPYRQLVWCSDESASLAGRIDGDAPASTLDDRALVVGSKLSAYAGPREVDDVVPQESLVITRSVSDERGVEKFVPGRFFRGLLPEQLLEKYIFWQQQSGAHKGWLVGELRRPEPNRPPTVLTVEFGDDDKHRSHARVYRQIVGSQEPPLELLNLSLAAGDSDVASLAALCSRLEGMSHVLAWGRADKVELVEFPRLQLTFKNHEGKLVSDQHEHYWLARRGDVISASTEALLKEFIGATALLCGDYGTRAILCSAGLSAGRAAVGGEVVLFEHSASPVCGHFVYPQHVSGQFVSPPDQSAAVHLLCMKWLAGLYADAADMIMNIFTDEATVGQISIFGRSDFLNDTHVDACALKMRLTAALLPFIDDCDTVFPWGIPDLVHNYVSKLRYVAAGAVVSLEDELAVLETIAVGTGSPEVENRRKILRGTSLDAAFVDVNLAFNHGDGWCSSGGRGDVDGVLTSTLSSWTKLGGYSKSTGESSEISGADAVAYLVENDTLHFMFIYEVFAGALSFKAWNEDDPHTVAACLSRTCVRGSDGLALVLRTLSDSPSADVQRVLPPLPKLSKFDILGQQKSKWLREVGGAISKLPMPPHFASPWRAKTSVPCPRPWMCAPFVESFDRDQREFHCDEVSSAFAERPLGDIVRGACLVRTGSGVEANPATQHLGKVEELLDDIGGHQACRSPLSRKWVARMKADVESFRQIEEEKESYFLTQGVEGVVEQARTRLREDGQLLDGLIRRATELANATVGSRERVEMVSGQEVSVNFCTLIRLFVTEDGAGILRQLKSGDAELDPEAAFNVVAQAMFVASRIEQLRRVLESAERAKGKGDEKTLSELCARRMYCGPVVNGRFAYDPRLLTCEFLFGILLRQGQVELLNKFTKAVADDEPMVHQMIMGAGKTTVLLPLLGLLFRSRQKLVVCCVTASLLEFTREVLRGRYSSPAIAASVITLDFGRSDSCDGKFLRKVLTAQRRQAVVVTTPQTLKSVALKWAELRQRLVDDDILKANTSAGRKGKRFFKKLIGRHSADERLEPLSTAERSEIEGEIDRCLKVLDVFQAGVILMDEVDLLLHPLKSELRWPLGEKRPLDMTEPMSEESPEDSAGLRWKLAWHIISVLLEDIETLGFANLKDALDVAGSIKETLRRGREGEWLSDRPHLLLHDRGCYEQQLLPWLCKWTLIWLRFHSVALQVTDSALAAFLNGFGEDETGICNSLGDKDVKLLLLARQWLQTILPFILEKRHLVDYGLLPSDWITPTTSKSRRLMAVPYVGKDRPSATSEFSHPDVLIGFTLLAYRRSGLRLSDFKALVICARDGMESEVGKPHYRRADCLRWVKWAREARARVRGFAWDGTPLVDIGKGTDKSATGTAWHEFEPSVSDAETTDGDDADDMDSIRNSLWPLELVDPRDTAQMDILWHLMRRASPSATIYYLFNVAFPAALSHTPGVLVASGQELGSPLLFHHRLGFSGTPNDLLPTEMGACQYDRGCDGHIAATLTDTDVVVGDGRLATLPAEWTVHDLLERASSLDGVYALIDCGALITGVSNLQVARELLRLLPEDAFDAVVFLDDSSDERLILERSNNGLVIPLAHSGLAPSRRFTFYDHIHTTGMDIPQPAGCIGMITLGKDTTFRDYAQSAFRLRGLGGTQRQKLSLITTTQVSHQILGDHQPRPITQQDLLLKVLARACVNSITSESSQFILLCQQNLENVWRWVAWKRMKDIPDESAKCLSILREPVDHTISTDPEADSLQLELYQKEERKLGNYSTDWLDMKSQNIARERLGELAAAVSRAPRSYGSAFLQLSGEQVEEQEQEQEEEQEQEQEQEVQQELEIETESEYATDQKYNRDKDPIAPWDLCQVCLDACATAKTFYPANQLTVSNGLLGQTAAEPLEFPMAMMVSNNFYRNTWKLRAVRRLKNVIVTFEFGPPQGIPVEPVGREVISKTVKNALELLDFDVAASLTREDVETLVSSLPRDMVDSAGISVDGIMQGQESITIKQLMDRVESEELGSPAVNLIDLDASPKRLPSEVSLEEYLAGPRLSGVVSLVEAEHIRVAMHRLRDDQAAAVEVASFSLRCPGLSARPLDASPSYKDTSRTFATTTVDQLWQFVDCERTGFTSQQLALMQTALEGVPYEARLKWWLRMRACRRRPQSQGSWQGSSIARVLISPEEARRAALKNALSLVRGGIAARGIRPSDLFMAWSEHHRDGITPQLAVTGLKGLHIPGLMDLHIQRVVQFLMNSDGVVTAKAWTEQFPDSLVASGSESSKSLTIEAATTPKIDPRQLEISDVDDRITRYKFRLVPHRHFTKIWSSSGISCAPLSVWRYSHLEDGGGWTTKRSPEIRVRINLGDLAVDSFKQPSHGLSLEVVDSVKVDNSAAPSAMTEWLNRYLPRPIAYRLIWSERRGEVPLNVWRPMPPSDEFVAVGVVFSTTPQEPSVEAVRCLPRVWLVREGVGRKLVWREDSRVLLVQERMGTVDAMKDEGGGGGTVTQYKLRKERYGAGRIFGGS